MYQTLDSLKIGDIAYIEEIRSEGSIRRRLLDIGLTPGCKVKCVLKSPSGDPSAYLIRGAFIAIRKEDATAIIIKGVEQNG